MPIVLQLSQLPSTRTGSVKANVSRATVIGLARSCAAASKVSRTIVTTAYLGQELRIGQVCDGPCWAARWVLLLRGVIDGWAAVGAVIQAIQPSNRLQLAARVEPASLARAPRRNRGSKRPAGLADEANMRNVRLDLPTSQGCRITLSRRQDAELRARCTSSYGSCDERTWTGASDRDSTESGNWTRSSRYRGAPPQCAGDPVLGEVPWLANSRGLSIYSGHR